MGGIISADETVFFWINGIAGKVTILDWLMRLFGDDFFIVTIMSLLLLFLWFGYRSAPQRRTNQRAVLCALVAVGITSLVIHLFMEYGPDRLRPYDAYPDVVNFLTYERTDPKSFPSESAAITFSFATGVWFMRRGRLVASMFVMASLLCLARVYIGLHYPLDILAGAAIGILFSFVAFGLLRLIEPVPTRVLGAMRRIYLA
jgi:undecaprenyl-diphosphatase